MSLNHDQDNEIIRDAVRGWVKKACSREAVHRWDEEGAIPKEVFREFASLGFCGMLVPEEYGGQGRNVPGACIVIEELAYASPALASLFAGSALYGGYMLTMLGSEEQQAGLLEKCAVATLAVAPVLDETDDPVASPQFGHDGDLFILDGVTGIVSMATLAGLYLVMAGETAGNSSCQNRTIFCIPAGTAGLVAEPVESLGYSGAGLGRVRLEGMRVSATDILGGAKCFGKGNAQRDIIRDIMALDGASQGVGLARAAFDYALDHARQRIQFGQPIGRFAAIRGMFARNASAIEAARLLVAQAAWLADEGKPAFPETAMAKCLSHEAARNAAFDCMQILGGYGYTLEYDAQRYVRDAVGLNFLGGTPDRLRESIADALQL